MKYRASYNRPQRGTTAVSVVATNTGSANVVFSVPFAAAPVVVAVTDSTSYFAIVDTITATGCRVLVKHFENTSATATVNVGWVAVL